MTGMITPNNKDGWDLENETFQEYKSRKTSHSKSISQPNSVIRQRGECKVTGVPKRKCSCRTCINRRNRSKGRTKQNAVRKKLKIPSTRIEKSGAKIHNLSLIHI